MVGFQPTLQGTPVDEPAPNAGPSGGDAPAQELTQSTEATPARWNEQADNAAYVGIGAFFAILMLVLLLVSRGRKERETEAISDDAGIFEPAGEDAEITFDEPDDTEEPMSRKKRGLFGGKKKDRKSKKHESESDHHEPQDETIIVETSEINEAITEDAPQRSPRPKFANLFSKNTAPNEPSEPMMNGDAQIATANDSFEEQHLIAERDEALRAQEAAKRATDDAARRDHEARLERERLERERLELERERAQDAAKRMAEERAKASHEYDRRTSDLSEREHLINEKANALYLKQEQMREDIDASVENKIATLTSKIDQKLNMKAAEFRHANGANDGVGRAELGAFFQQIEATLAKFSDRLDAFEVDNAGAEKLAREIGDLKNAMTAKAGLAAAGRLQLNELVRSALAPNCYAFNRKLNSGRVADCLISISDNRTPHAINARFPVEAFDRYAATRAQQHDGSKNAANEYRRVLLRHIVDIAESLIVPGETANAAICFVPSDIIFNNLYEDFLDVTQDAMRARVWIVSPTSLMAIVHMMDAAAPTQEAHNDHLSEIQTLRNRVHSLEDRGSKHEYGADIAKENPFVRARTYAEPDMRISNYRDPAHADSQLVGDSYGQSATSLSAEEKAFERLERKEAEESQENTTRPA